jgi:hypothetical protein
LARPTLARSISEPAAKSEPDAIKSNRISRWDIHRELEELVKASTHDDSDEDDDDENAKDRYSSSTENDGGKFHFNDGWRRKGIRETRRQRRAKSEGTVPSPEAV